MPPGVTWRIHNSTFRCTGNDTHPLPSGGAAAAAGGAPSQAQVAVASLATLASLLAGAYWLLNRNGESRGGGRGLGRRRRLMKRGARFASERTGTAAPKPFLVFFHSLFIPDACSGDRAPQ